MSPTERDKPSPASPGGEDDIIELTEVVESALAEAPEDAPAEVVLDFSSGGHHQESLKSLVKLSEERGEHSSKAPREESLDDFLASLPDLPEEMDTAPETPPPPQQTASDPGPELVERLSDEDLREMVRQVIEEKVERLAREVFPEMARRGH
jgi:hypothetical protein